MCHCPLKIAFVVVTAFVLGDRVGPAPRFAHSLTLEAQFGEEALQRDGREGLARALKWLDETRPGRHYLIDENGRDVLDGTDRGELVAAAERPSNWPGPPSIAIGDPTPTGHRRMIIARERPPEFGLIFIWIPVGVIAACLGIVYFALRPVRRLQDAVKRFGRGDYSVRSGVSRHDEIGRLAAEFDRMAEKVERVVAAERRLLQDVSHELRSPLARLAFALELAERGSDRAAGLARARKEYGRMRDLVGELVELTRAEAEGTPPPTEQVDLTALIAEIAQIAAAFAWVAVYSYLINPGQPMTTYEAHAQASGPWVSVLAGAPIFYAASRWIARSRPTALALFSIFLVVDGGLLVVMTESWTAVPFVLIGLSYLTTLCACALSTYPPGAGWRDLEELRDAAPAGTRRVDR